MKTRSATLSAALVAAVLVLLAAAPIQAQQPPASPSPGDPAQAPAAPAAAPAASPTPAPTPMPVLRGANYETMRALAAALQTETRHALEGAGAAAAAGRPVRMFMPGIRMFARRAQWFRDSIDKYQAQPIDVVGVLSMMNRRANLLGKRVRSNPGLEHTFEDWDAALDLIDRMQKLLAGEKVTVPPPHTPRPAPTLAVDPAAAPQERPARDARPLPAVPVPPPPTAASPSPAAGPSPSPSPSPTPPTVPR